MRALKKEFGFAFDDKIASFAAVAEKTGAPPQLLAAIKQGTIDTVTAKWLDGLVRSLGGENAEFRRQEGGGSGRLTPEEARIQISEIQKNPAYFRKGVNPELHESLKMKLAKLMPFAYPEDAARS